MDKVLKQNQVVAISKGVKERTHRTVSDLHKSSMKETLWNGFTKTYTPKKEGGTEYPPEKQIVQLRFEDVLTELNSSMDEYLATELTKDSGNAIAKADVVVDDKVVLANVPATFLISLEKSVRDIQKFIEEMPTRDEAYEWAEDENARLARSEEISRHRTEKVEEPIVLYDATEHHPAQTQMITNDRIVGHWKERKLTGAITASKKKDMLGKTKNLLTAIKFAREEANETAVESRTAEGVLKYIFA